jgi:hypothetical protein
VSEFDGRFRNKATAAAPVDYLLTIGKIVGLSFGGAILDAVIKGATGAETNFKDTAFFCGTGWYIFGPGSPDEQAKSRNTKSTTPPSVAQKGQMHRPT